MFREFLAHSHEALQKRHLVQCAGVTSAGCTILVQSPDITRTQYTKCRLCIASYD
jgi:hypothetical protein